MLLIIQTGVAQKHYNNSRRACERMPGTKPGQVFSYPQRRWVKKSYQYLQHFLLPRHLRYEAAERAAIAATEHTAVVAEETNSARDDKWGDFYMNDDEYAMADPGSEPESDSDFEYEGGRTRRGKGKKAVMPKSRTPARSSRSSRRLEEEMSSPLSDRSSRAAKRGGMPEPPPHGHPMRGPPPPHPMIPTSVMGMRPHPGHPGHPGGHPGHPGHPGGHPGHMMPGPPPGHNGHFPPHQLPPHYQPILPAPPKTPAKVRGGVTSLNRLTLDCLLHRKTFIKSIAVSLY